MLSLESSGQDISGTWELQGTPGSFSPAGWYNSEAPALTRVQAARMKLVITAAVDERFDPVKGKKATLKFYKINDVLKYENELRINAGTVLLVGTKTNLIVSETLDLLDNEKRFTFMSELHNPYGDGKACERIVEYMAALEAVQTI